MQGTYTAIITPFKDGKIDYESMENVIEHNIEGGVDGLVPCGTTGESPTLSHTEQKKLIAFVVRKVAGRVRVIAGSGSNSTEEAVALTRAAAAAGADGSLLVCPYYNKPTQEGLFVHYKTISDSVPSDYELVLYNVPGRSGVRIADETVVRLAELSNIKSLKDATGDIDTASSVINQTPDDFNVVSGNDSVTLPLISVGGKGVISVVSNFLPAPVKEMTDYALAGNTAEAAKLHHKLWQLFKVMFIKANPIPVKAACYQLGLINSAHLRLPLVNLCEDDLVTVTAALKKFGLKF
ncbi:MAG TPA: 4-hydroxy-tetrahydrodipicolinate synthase [Spirochaetota bacterium]|nr:4-hydroxy-tetrahydrodipicolinate synthase [Spirochaetota bacterium]